jgi:hypothetical protein
MFDRNGVVSGRGSGRASFKAVRWFADPDAVPVIAAPRQTPGLVFITRALRERYPFVNPE